MASVSEAHREQRGIPLKAAFDEGLRPFSGGDLCRAKRHFYLAC